MSVEFNSVQYLSSDRYTLLQFCDKQMRQK